MFSSQNIAARYTFSAHRHIFARSISQQFRRFTRVVARLLHGAPRFDDQNFQFLRRLQEV
jgi:hypothetical protein